MERYDVIQGAESFIIKAATLVYLFLMDLWGLLKVWNISEKN